ncbi:hypothetical protein [Haloarchaeobius sp. TZWWS8]|uniref:hypothetical protein n=1 Tax=Haloarchaeobius sp. TZWWS8 TaxID=3446121 RepID=UPI003EBBC449
MNTFASPVEGETRRRRRIDVTDLRTRSVADYAQRRAREGDVTFERRGGYTYLLTEREE